GGEVEALVANADFGAVVGSQFGIEGLGVLRGDAEAKPIDRRAGELWPSVEKLLSRMICGLKFTPGQAGAQQCCARTKW
ncbi:MAG TPA: hypothetical protein VH022_04225, partial [Candidatus Acidoferrum sp.]|nr:hypothetical protein [Candidatus Acidoferrum sp.]